MQGARSPVELITNATLLTEKMSQELIDLGLDMLWVSLDGQRLKVLLIFALEQLYPEWLII